MQKTFKPTNCENCPSLDKGIFCDLENEALNGINHHKVMNLYKRGQTIFFQGNPPLGLHCIASGKIKVSKMAGDGKESILRISGPGDVLGHRSLFSKDNYTATATVIEDAAICFLEKNYIYSTLKAEPSIALNLIQKLSLGMGAAENRNASMSTKNARERLAELLLSFRKSYGVQEEDGRIKLEIKLSRDEMASMVGTAHETIIRLISEFKEERILEQEGKIIYILNEDKLLQFANLEF